MNCRTASRVRRVDREPLVEERDINFHQIIIRTVPEKFAHIPEYRLHQGVFGFWTCTRLGEIVLRHRFNPITNYIPRKKRTPCRTSRIHSLLSNGAFTTRAENNSTRFGTADFGETPAKPTSKERVISRPCVARSSFFSSVILSFEYVSLISVVYQKVSKRERVISARCV